MKTYSLKPSSIKRQWYILDASEASLGRLSTKAARLLLGKDKPAVANHIDNGDFVVVINADKLKVTGDKRQSKLYYRHSGYPGALRQRSLEEQLQLDSTKVVQIAVRGMLPDNKLRRERLLRLKIYSGSDHSHDPQQPLKVSIQKEVKNG